MQLHHLVLAFTCIDLIDCYRAALKLYISQRKCRPCLCGTMHAGLHLQTGSAVGASRAGVVGAHMHVTHSCQQAARRIATLNPCAAVLASCMPGMCMGNDRIPVNGFCAAVQHCTATCKVCRRPGAMQLCRPAKPSVRLQLLHTPANTVPKVLASLHPPQRYRPQQWDGVAAGATAVAIA